jgi:hypothetical protein
MFVLKNWDKSVSIQVQGSIHGCDSDFYLLPIIDTSFGANPASYSGGAGDFSPRANV